MEDRNKSNRLSSQRIITILGALFITLVFSNCTSFRSDWKEAMSEPFEGIEGPWDGTWKSDFNGHNGRLRCVVTKTEDDTYEFHYWATWAGVLNGSFRADHEVTPDGEKFALEGEKDLGALGGKFTFTGSMTGDHYKAEYRSSGDDFGVFELKRPEGAPPREAKAAVTEE